MHRRPYLAKQKGGEKNMVVVRGRIRRVLDKGTLDVGRRRGHAATPRILRPPPSARGSRCRRSSRLDFHRAPRHREEGCCTEGGLAGGRDSAAPEPSNQQDDGARERPVDPRRAALVELAQRRRQPGHLPGVPLRIPAGYNLISDVTPAALTDPRRCTVHTGTESKERAVIAAAGLSGAHVVPLSLGRGVEAACGEGVCIWGLGIVRPHGSWAGRMQFGRFRGGGCGSAKERRATLACVSRGLCSWSADSQTPSQPWAWC
ncbi:hypothetical protein BU16DRAFT_236025 [Lophium mytilinum]|uniref:Uncharacterized protein n=1 Tax=Lophium mytilinum TaxID=390894 RepID=A0A6A6R6K4_9PEZI|nr:hypothetical protein BU16DRAFT_236025 [Lophium mytilinum]